MKEHDIKLDILENAEDEIIGELVPFSSDSEKTRKRVLSMSEKKYREMKKNFENVSENTVQGVEKYRRPIWYAPVCAAAAVALIAGGTGIFALARNSGKPVSSTVPAAEVNEIQPTETAGVACDTEPEPAPEPEPAVLTEDEMRALAEEFLLIELDLSGFHAENRIDENADKLTFWAYHCMTDENFDDIGFPEYKDIDGVRYTQRTYYKLNDPRFGTISELREYYAPKVHNLDVHLNIGGDVSGYNDGDLITERELTKEIIEYNGELYALRYPECIYPVADDCKNNILSDKLLSSNQNGFIWERKFTSVDKNGDQWWMIDIELSRDSDGNWKLGGYGINGYDGVSAYDSGTYFNGDEYPITSGDGIVPGTELAIEEMLEKAEAYIAANEPGGEVYIYDRHWESISELPEYYHVTDDFVKDGNWIRVTLSPENDSVLGDYGVYIDSEGTIFGLDYRD